MRSSLMSWSRAGANSACSTNSPSRTDPTGTERPTANRSTGHRSIPVGLGHGKDLLRFGRLLVMHLPCVFPDRRHQLRVEPAVRSVSKDKASSSKRNLMANSHVWVDDDRRWLPSAGPLPPSWVRHPAFTPGHPPGDALTLGCRPRADPLVPNTWPLYDQGLRSLRPWVTCARAAGPPALHREDFGCGRT